MGIIHPKGFRSMAHVERGIAELGVRVDVETKVPAIGHAVAFIDLLHFLRRLATHAEKQAKTRRGK